MTLTVWCGSCADRERGLRARPGEHPARGLGGRWGGWVAGRLWGRVRCSTCGAEARVVAGRGMALWRLLRLLLWGCMVVAMVAVANGSG